MFFFLIGVEMLIKYLRLTTQICNIKYKYVFFSRFFLLNLLVTPHENDNMVSLFFFSDIVSTILAKHNYY